MTYPYRRHFPTLGISVKPDEVVVRDENPDPNFFELVEVEESSKPKAGHKAVAAQPEEN